MARHATHPAVPHNPRTVSQTGLLLDCASAATCFTTAHAQVCASLHLGPAGRQAWPLRSTLSQYWRLTRFYHEHETAPRDPSWRAALRIPEVRAHCHSAPPLQVHRRLAGRDKPLEIIGLDDRVTPHPQKLPRMVQELKCGRCNMRAARVPILGLRQSAGVIRNSLQENNLGCG